MFKRTTAVLAVVFMTIVFAGNTPKVTAATSDGSRSISVTPPSFELYANPGDSVTEKIKVRNESGVDTTYQVMVEDFKAVGEEGSVDLIDDQSNTTYSLAKWVFPEPKSFTLKAGAEKEIPFSINVPKNAEPGGHYCSVLIKVGGDSKVEGGASVASRVGSLILLRVSGNVTESADVESFTTNKSYYQGSPVDFELRVKNAGNNHIKPAGTIVITNMFGQKITEIPVNGLNVLPGAIRKMSTEWTFNAFLANRYTATLVATYGQQNKSLSSSTSFIIFPKSLIYISIGVLVLILALVLGKSKIKKMVHNLTK